ncbi:MAG: c-type cytochrome [Cytophagales bacterium]|nr:c-type cytochrome [Cytophagales bacterium]
MLRFLPFRALCLLLAVSLPACREKKTAPPGEPGRGGLVLPGHFEALVVVDSLPGRARHLAVRDNGDIYVKARYGGKDSSVIALRDTTGDGKADLVARFGGSGQESGYGTAARIHNGYLYFSSELVVYRYRLTPGKLVPESPQEVVLTDDHPHGSHEHIAKPLTFDAQGNLYVPFGAPSNCCQVQNRTPNSPGMYPCSLLVDHGGVWRFRAGQTGQTQKDGTRYATGLRSVVAMDWNAADGNLYLLQHGRDDLLRLWPQQYSPWQSALLPSEEFFRVKEGLDGGWPYFYYDHLQGKKVLNPEYEGQENVVGDGSRLELPLMGFPGHWAPNDVLFYRGDQFPERYRNGAFIAFHGSTNRTPYPQSSYFVGFIPFAGGRPTGQWEVFADGFTGVDPVVHVSDARYRPMGLAEGPDGSLYIAETERGKIWRVLYRGEKAAFGPDQLAAMEGRKTLSHLRTPDETQDLLVPDNEVAGAQLYATYCATCHQGNGLGDSGRFPPLAGSEWVTGSKEKLVRVVLNGLEGPILVKGRPYNNVMPQHRFLKDEDIAAVLTYIRGQFGNRAGPVSAGEVRALRGNP